MSESPQLTVVVPTHDVDAWVDDCLLSLRMQTGVDLTIIVVDDHSTDGTLDIVERHAAEDPRVRVLRAPTVGGGSARNLGISHVETEYLAFADGDDLVPPGAYEALVTSLTRTKSDVAIGDFYKFSAHESWRPASRWGVFTEYRPSVTLQDLPALIRNRACWNRVFRTDFWRRNSIEFPDVPRSNDIVPMTTALTAARALDVVPDVVYLYRARPGSGSMTAQASASVALRSYLEQEVRCARLIGDADEELLYVYSRLVLDADGWVHLRGALRSGAPWDDSDMGPIAAALTELLERVDRSAIDRMPTLQRVATVLVSRGAIDSARELLELADVGWDPMAVSRAMHLMATVLQTTAEPPEWRRRALAELVVDPLMRVARFAERGDLEDAIRLAATVLDPDTAMWLDAEARFPRRAAAAAISEEDAVGLQRVSARAADRVEVVGVRSDRGRFTVRSTTTWEPTRITPRVIGRNDARRKKSFFGGATLTPDPDGLSWSVTVDMRGLAHGEWQIFALMEDREFGRYEVPLIAASFIPQTPGGRWEPSVVLPRKAGERLVVFQRGRLLDRLARKILRRLRR